MFGIGAPELLIILAVALIVIGPKKLPDLARSLGRALGEFRRATNDLKQSIEQETGLDEIRKDITGAGREAMASLKPDLVEPPPASAETSQSREKAVDDDPSVTTQPVRSADDQTVTPHPENQMEDGPSDSDITAEANKDSEDDDPEKAVP